MSLTYCLSITHAQFAFFLTSERTTKKSMASSNRRGAFVHAMPIKDERDERRRQELVDGDDILPAALLEAKTSKVELAALFECPVCFDYVLPPILQCNSGHLVCSSCRPKLACCPSCRGPLPVVRNLAMEKVCRGRASRKGISGKSIIS